MNELSKEIEQLLRKGLALIAWVLIFIFSHLVTGYFLEVDWMWGWALWAGIMSFSIQPFMVSVSEYTILVTINLWSGELREYKTGLWCRYPWEQAKKGNYINTRLIPVDREEDYPARDGPKMHAKWQFWYRVVDAIKFVRIGREAAEKALTATGSSILSAYTAKHDAEDAKENQASAETALQEKFSNMDPPPLESLGVEIPEVLLADLDYEPIVQKVRATQFVANKLKEIGQDLRAEQEDIKPKDSLNAAMIIHGDVTKHVNEVEGEGGNALAALLMAMAQGGGGRKEGDKK
jgi:hypothetical protein